MEYKGYTIVIENDNDPINPREEYDNLGTMVCFHNRYCLGDKKTGYTKEEVMAIAKDKSYVSLPLYLYDHSGVTMSTKPFSCSWDSGQVGVIFVSKEDIRKEYSCKNVTKKLKEKVLNVLRSEVETYDNYLTGEVYGYTIKDSDLNEYYSCWGFYGSDHEKSGLLEYAKCAIDCQVKEDLEKGIQLDLFEVVE
jgi:hypothetical protein